MTVVRGMRSVRVRARGHYDCGIGGCSVSARGCCAWSVWVVRVCMCVRMSEHERGEDASDCVRASVCEQV